MNNKVDRPTTGCAGARPNCETISNGSQSDQTECCGQIANDIKTLLKAKSCNGILNGVREGNNAAPVNSDTSHATRQEETHNMQVTHEERSAKKSRSKRKNKTENNVDTKCDLNHCLQDDFDITTIIRNKYKQEGSEDKLKIVVNQIERLGLKEENSLLGNEPPRLENPNIEYVAYQSELQMPLIMKIIQKDLSEPYSIYTYRYFIHNWPNLCFLAMHDDKCVGAIVCKLDMHRKVIKRGYIAMLAVDKQYRKHGLGSTLVKRAIQEMVAGEADEVVLETEITNRPALRLYEALGFVRDKRLFRYYLNGVDALRLKLWLR